MSHIVSIAVEVRDPVALAAACNRLELPAPVERTVRFYDGSEVSGQAVELTGWRYPVVFDLAGGMKYDDFEGRWGERRHLDSLLQSYAVEKAKIEARRHGYAAHERPLADGSVRVTVTVGGAA